MSKAEGHSLVAWTAIIAGRLRLRRKEAGWTQAQLAAAMTRLGFDWKRITVAEAEGGGRRVSLEELLGLAILYGEPVVGLLLPDASEHLRFPPNRALEPAIVFELLLGSNGSLGHGGDDWAAARNAALVRPRDEDWRPAPMLWKRRVEHPTGITALAGTPPLVTTPTVTPRAFDVTHRARGWTANAAHNMHHYERSRHVAEWRHAFAIEAILAKVPHLDRVAITVETRLKGNRSQDVCANAPAVKAAIDGVVDARVIPDDTPTHLVSVTFLAPVFGAERDQVTLRIVEVNERSVAA